MNGYWTCPDYARENAHEILGDLVPPNAISFFARLADMGVTAQVATFMPKQIRELFYAGKCVMIVRNPGLVEIVNVEIFKKGLTPPPDKA